MAFCPNCGSQANGSFCPNCGTPLAGTSSGYTTGTSSRTTGAMGMSENVAGALCYLVGFITGIIFLVIAPYNQNKFVRFHAFQSIFTHFGIILLSTLLSIVTHGLFILLFPLALLAIVALWIYMMVTAYQGKTVRLPLVGDLAAKQV
ncbi:MAG: hypothetical protein JO185_12990 [Acidobacteriaceae bacterium]|nr:hypothetical protein [Acidobacteriaceae bacterium]